MMKSTHKHRILVLIGIGIIIGMSLFTTFFQFEYLQDNTNKDGTLFSSPEASQADYDIGFNSFNSTGSQLNVSLYSFRKDNKSNTVDDGGITIQNIKDGWNITDFSLNFTDITAKEELVKFETRNDGSLEFNNADVYYANSFRIPNDCHLSNISMFVQYPGGTGTAGFERASSFNITIYNCSSNMEPESPIHDLDDETYFDLSDKVVSQPARWYQSNFTDLTLNTSKTYNNTFFTVFQSYEFPSGFTAIKGYIYYADILESDNIFYENKGNWKEISGKNGLFKVGFSPIEPNPTAKQINLTVLSTQLDSNVYENNTFFPHENNAFFIPISSPWFGEVLYDVNFEGRFQYNTLSTSQLSANSGEVVNWSLSLQIDNFQGDSYNRSAIFYKPDYWNYMKSYNGTKIHNNVNPRSNYVKLLNISDGDWVVNFNQANNIINSSYYTSDTKSDWTEFDTEVNAYNYINITSNFNNSNGDALLYVYNPQLDLQIQEDLTQQEHSFPLWRPRYNTSIFNNETEFQVNIMTNNGTMAGFMSKNFTVILNKTIPTLTLHGNLGDLVYGDTLNLWAKLSDNAEPLQGEVVYFEFIINGGATQIILNDTTDDEGIARVSYEIGEISSIQVSAYFEGSIDYTSSTSSTSNIIVRSPLEQFFWDFLPYMIFIIIGVMAIGTYVIVKRLMFKRNMKEWKRKTEIFSDVLAIDLILVIHKEIGVALLKQNFTTEEIDGDMISGFLQAITSFKYEIKDRNQEKAERESILLDYRDYKILLEDGEYIRCALVLNSEPSENLESSQQEFINDFETQYLNGLKNFTGELKAFKDAGDLIDEHFNMSFIKPHIVNENPPAISLDSFQERVLGVCKTIQADTEQFYISRVLEYLISAMPDEPKEKLIANIYDVKEYGFINPL